MVLLVCCFTLICPSLIECILDFGGIKYVQLYIIIFSILNLLLLKKIGHRNMNFN